MSSSPVEAVTSESDLMASCQWFLSARRLAGRTPKTLDLYRRAVQQLDDWLRETGRTRQMDELGHEDLIRFFMWYRETRAASTTATVHAYLRSFWKWAHLEGLVPSDPMLRVPPPRVPESLPHVITDEEFARLLAAASGTTYLARRDTAILRVLESTGMRRGELATALLEDVDLDAMTMKVMGKGARPRFVAFDDEANGALRHYMRLRAREAHAGRPEVFISRYGRMAPNAVTDMVYTRARQAGLTGMHPHLLRHRFAHRMKSAGMTDESLRSLGGWSSSVYLEKYGRANRSSRAVTEYQRIRRGGS